MHVITKKLIFEQACVHTQASNLTLRVREPTRFSIIFDYIYNQGRDTPTYRLCMHNASGNIELKIPLSQTINEHSHEDEIRAIVWNALQNNIGAIFDAGYLLQDEHIEPMLHLDDIYNK